MIRDSETKNAGGFVTTGFVVFRTTEILKGCEVSSNGEQSAAPRFYLGRSGAALVIVGDSLDNFFVRRITCKVDFEEISE